MSTAEQWWAEHPDEADAIMAATDLCDRVHAKFEIGFASTDEGDRYWASGQFGDQVLTASGHAMPGDAADALAAEVIARSTCPVCGLKAKVGERPMKGLVSCFWVRRGDVWVSACVPDPRPPKPCVAPACPPIREL